jgi:hypothetical protein
MNWFGLFTMAMLVVLAVWGFAFEYGYEKAEKDWTMSDEWIARQQALDEVMRRSYDWGYADGHLEAVMEQDPNYETKTSPFVYWNIGYNHPSNKDWN